MREFRAGRRAGVGRRRRGPARSSPQTGGDDVSVLIKGGGSSRPPTTTSATSTSRASGSRCSESRSTSTPTASSTPGQVRAAGVRRPAHAPRHAVRRNGDDRRRHVRGQTAAAFGGTTCHVDFVIQPPGSTFAEALDDWHGKARASRSSTWATTWRSPTCARAARSRSSPVSPSRASPRTSSSWPTRARSWSTTRRSSARWRSPRRRARS